MGGAAGRRSAGGHITKTWNRKTMLFAGAAGLVALLLVISGVYFISSRDKGKGGTTAAASQPTTETQAGWKPITNARVAREAATTTQADGTIWIFGGIGKRRKRQRTA